MAAVGPSSQAPKLPSSQAPKLPSSQAPKLPSSQAPKLPSSQAPKLPSSQAPKLPSSQDALSITLNGAARDAAPGASLADLLRESGRDPQKPGIAVALNERVVPRSRWSETPVAAGDRIEVLTALAGG